MTRLRVALLAAVCLIVPANLAWSAPAPAERSGLEQVPASAPIVVYLHGVQRTHDRFVAMMQNALPDVLKMFQPQMDNFLKEGADGRKLSGLTKDGPIFLIVPELPDPNAGRPPYAIMIAVSNYKEFRDNILKEEERKNVKDKGNGIEAVTFDNEALYFVDRKGFVVITPNEDVATDFTKKQIGLHTKLSKEVAGKLLAGDAGVYVNMEAVNKKYGEQIKEAKDGIEQMLAPIAAIGDESQKQAVELFKKAIGPTFQAIEDMQSVLVTVEFRPGGLATHVQSNLRDETPTANLLKDSRPVDFKELERLPNGRAYYGAMKTSAAMYKGLGSLMVGIPLVRETVESKDVAAAIEEMAKAGPNVRLDGHALPLTGLQVYQYDDPAKAVEAQLKLVKALAAAEPKDLGLKEKPVLKTDAETYGDAKFHSLQVVWDFDKMAEQSGKKTDQEKKQYAEAAKGVLGEKMTLWFGKQDKALVQVIAANWNTARKLLDQYTKGTGSVGEVKAYQEVRKEMPARASYLGLFDSVNLTGSLLEAFLPLMPGGQLPKGFKMPAKNAPAFVGLAVTLQPQRGSFDVFISAAAAQEFYKSVVEPLMQLR